MRPLREDERDEIESVKHLIKYVLTKPNIEEFQIYGALKELEKIGKKYVLSGIVTEKELAELTDLDDSKELVEKFMSMLFKNINAEEAK